MGTLRWILLILGLALIAGIYLYGRYRGSKPERIIPSSRQEPQIPPLKSPVSQPLQDTAAAAEKKIDDFDLELGDLTDLIKDAIADSGHNVSRTAKQVSLPDLLHGNIVVINLLSAEGAVFKGPELLALFDDYNIHYGAMRIFHYYESGKRLFSIANITEPGTFEPDAMQFFATKGITVFMQLAELQDPLKAVERALVLIGKLAERLPAKVCDRKHKPLTPETARQLLQAVDHYAENREAL